MSSIIEAIEVDVPVRVAYDQWTQFEEFPRFMEAVESVEQVDDQTLEWTAKVGGVRKHWRARITEQVPDQRIAWSATEGAQNAGMVSFEQIDPSRTRVVLQLDVEPDGAKETIGDALGVTKRTAAGDMRRFKDFIEERQIPTGAWRGEIDDDPSAARP